MKRLLVLGCETMREGVMVTAIFLVVGMVLILAGIYVVPDFAYMQHIILLIGFLLLLFVPVILVSTFLISVIARKKMDECNH